MVSIKHPAVHILPGQEGTGQDDKKRVAGLADDREGDQRDKDLVGLAELLAIDEEIAEAFRCAHDLGQTTNMKPRQSPVRNATTQAGSTAGSSTRRVPEAR